MVRDTAAGKAWIEAQKDALKWGHIVEVLRVLALHCEDPETSDEQTQIQLCHRYLGTRKNHLKYDEPLTEVLPIVSEEIESAHRYIPRTGLRPPAPGGALRTPNIGLLCGSNA